MSRNEGRTVTREEVLARLLAMVQALAALAPADCLVVGGRSDDRTAVLHVEATVMGQRSRAEVTMALEAGKWQVVETGPWRDAEP
jgi:hypothetical protein